MDKSTLDLVFFSGEPDLVCNVQDLGNFSSSDHKLIFCNLDIAAKTATGNKKSMIIIEWMYME